MMNYCIELIAYWAIKALAVFVRALPVSVAIPMGQLIGTLAYYLDKKHRDIAYGNLKIAFANSKSVEEIKEINKKTFQNYGQNIIELLRLPSMTREKFDHYVEMQGEEHIQIALKQGKGLIFLAMHYGSWEMANLWSTVRGYPYKVLVKAQSRHSRLSDLLNSYRGGNGAAVIERGAGTRDFIKSLKENEIVALVADQGGRDGLLVPFFGREASMSVGAIRVALKLGVPICFAVIHRKQGPYHRLILHKPLDLVDTGDIKADLNANLRKITELMEKYIREYPSEYMWFYKIWKYSTESSISILSDGRTGHLRQAQAVSNLLQDALLERGITAQLSTLEIKFKNSWTEKIVSLAWPLAQLFGRRGRLAMLKAVLTSESFKAAMSVKPEFIISCGSAIAPVTYLLSQEHGSKRIAILNPGTVGARRFDLVLLPKHDQKKRLLPLEVTVVSGAPNLITDEYLQEQTAALLKRYSHLKTGDNLKIGVLIGGDTKDFVLTEQRVRVLLHQVVEAAEETRADLLVTTSRRTSTKIENLLMRELKKYSRCKFLLIANRENVPEAVGGILGLCDVVIVSADSISMLSEAACAGKKIIAFPVEHLKGTPFESTKHGRFLDRLNSDGYVLASDVKNIKDSFYKLIKNKVQTRRLDDRAVILEAIKKVI